MPLRPLLRLTEEERKWNSYYGRAGGKPGVIQRVYPASVILSSSQPTASVVFRTSRRCRVYGITWSGDTNALRVAISSATGEQYTDGPCHIPLLSGHSPHSTLDVVPFLPPWPNGTNTDYALRAPPAWDFEIEPNWTLPANKQLQFDYTLENPQDPALTGQDAISYEVEHVVCVWEFPGWKGDPRT